MTYRPDQNQIVDKMSREERAWYDGFATALLFAQAYYDKPEGMQTLKMHLPEERWDPTVERPTGLEGEWVKLDDFEEKLEATIGVLDEEGGITVLSFHEEPAWYGDRKPIRILELGGSEGYHGLPDWD